MQMLAVVVAAAVAAGGCIEGVATFRSTITPGKAAPIERLLVLLDTGGEGDWYEGVQVGLKNGLAGCGVAPTVLVSVPLELEPVGRALETARAMGAGAVLAIVGHGATATFRDFNAERVLSFELWIVDLASRKVTWAAEADLKVTTGPWMAGKSSGAHFAASIIARLRTDGVLASCARPGTPSPRRGRKQEERS
jgi:hypothetical protein